MNSFELTLPSGKTAAVTIRRSARARRIRLRVTQAGPELVIPQFVPLESALAFLRAQTAWLEQTLRAMRPAPLPARPQSIALAFTGETLAVVYTSLETVWTGARQDADVVTVSGDVSTDAACISALREWLKRKAKAVLLPFAEQVCAECGFTPSGFGIGLARSTWGTCSSKRKIMLNAGLLFFPPEIVRYVIIHEGCHLTEMNHSLRFWSLVRRFYPYPEHARGVLNGRGNAFPAWVHAKI